MMKLKMFLRKIIKSKKLKNDFNKKNNNNKNKNYKFIFYIII